MCFNQKTYNLCLANKDFNSKYDINKLLISDFNDTENLYLYKSILGNKYINKGYRLNYNLINTLKSLFSLHNETINIWTHLFPFFINLSVFFISDNYFTRLFFILTSPIFLASSLFHLLIPIIKTLYQYHFLLLLDMLGIVLGVAGIETYIFNKFVSDEIFYPIIIFYTINLIPLINLLNFQIHVVECRNKIIKYLFIVNSIILSIIFFNFKNNDNNINPFYILILNLVFIFSLIINMILHYPEKACSNKFDLFCSSHQIWHIVVIFYIYGIYYIT